MKWYSHHDLDMMLDTDPLELRDLAWDIQCELDQAKRLLYKLINAVERGRTSVNEVIYDSKEMLGM